MIIITGILAGFLLAVPIGPTGIVCIRRGITKGGLSALLTGFGAATADLLCAAVPAFGMILIINFITEYQDYFRLFSAVVLIILGIKIFLSKPRVCENGGLIKCMAQKCTTHSLVGDYVSGFLITITNPITIISFSIVFTNFGFKNFDYTFSLLLTAGVFIGSIIWWLSLISFTMFIKEKFNFGVLKIIDKATAIGIEAFAVFLIASVVIRN